MAQTVIGIFDKSEEAQHAVERLVNNGFLRDRIDLSLHDESSEVMRDSSSEQHDHDSFGEKVSRFFKSLFDNDDEGEKYSNVVRRGAALVTVTSMSGDEAERAADILDECGAVDVDERSQAYANGTWASNNSGSDGQAERTEIESERRSSDRLQDSDLNNRSIPIIEEQLRVGKREVERGGVRLRSRIVERPVEETVRLREERITVDRNTVDRPVSTNDLETFREGEVEVRERAEIPVVSKEARVVEEINLNKDVTEREETIRDTVRRTEVEVDEDRGDLDIDNDESISERRQRKNEI